MDMRAPHTFGQVVMVQKKQRWEVSTWGKIYAALVLVETIALGALCIASLIYARAHRNEEVDAESVEYTSIVALVASVALLYFSLDSILLENIFQFFAAQLLHGLICAYVIWHYTSTGLGALYDRISLWVMVGVCTFQLAYILLMYPVTHTFGWRLYKKIGGNVAIRPLYRMATIFFTLLKLDFALGVLLVLLAIFYLVSQTAQIVINVFACIATLGWLVLGFQFVQRESRRIGVLFFAFALLEPAYLIYKLVAIHRDANSASDGQFSTFSWNQFLLTGCVAVSVRLACVVAGAVCMGNFGRGLKEKMFTGSGSDRRPVRRASRAEPLAYPAASPNHGAHAQVADAPVTVVIEQNQGQHNSQLLTYLQPLL